MIKNFSMDIRGNKCYDSIKDFLGRFSAYD